MRDIHGTVKLLGLQLGTLAKNCQVVVTVMDEQEKRIKSLEKGQSTELAELRIRLEKAEATIEAFRTLPGARLL